MTRIEKYLSSMPQSHKEYCSNYIACYILQPDPTPKFIKGKIIANNNKLSVSADTFILNKEPHLQKNIMNMRKILAVNNHRDAYF